MGAAALSMGASRAWWYFKWKRRGFTMWNLKNLSRAFFLDGSVCIIWQVNFIVGGWVNTGESQTKWLTGSGLACEMLTLGILLGLH